MAYFPAIQVPANGGFLNPNIVSGTGNTQAFNSVYDAFIINEWFKIKTRNNQKKLQFSQLLQAYGAIRGNNSPTTGNYELGKITENLFVGNIVSVVNPQTVIVELSASSMLNQGGVIQSFPQTYQRGVTPRTKRPFWISNKNTAVTPHQVTLSAANSTDNIAADIAAGQRLFLTYPVGVEGSPFRKPVVNRFTRYTNTFELIVSAPSQTTDVAATDMYRWELEGNSVGYAVDNALLDDRHQIDKSNALIFGTTADSITENIAPLGQTLTNVGSQGLISFMEDYAFDLQYATINYFLFERIVNIFAKEQTVSTSFECYNGIDFQQGAQSALADYGRELYTDKLPLLSYKSDETNEGLFLETGAFGFKMNGYSFRFIELPNLTDNTQGGTPGYDYSFYSLILPAGVFRNNEDGNDYPAAMMEFKQTPQLSLNNHVRINDGAGLYGSMVSAENAITKMEYRSAIALHLSCGNNMMLVTKI